MEGRTGRGADALPCSGTHVATRCFVKNNTQTACRKYFPLIYQAFARALPRDAHDDNRLYAVVIRAAQKAGDWREAVLLYREAEAANLGPSAATATTVFLACYAEQRVRERSIVSFILCFLAVVLCGMF